MDSASEKPLSIHVPHPGKPTCPRCGSEMILIGRLADESGHRVMFAPLSRTGDSQPVGSIRSCYCNDCGEVTLTLD